MECHFVPNKQPDGEDPSECIVFGAVGERSEKSNKRKCESDDNEDKENETKDENEDEDYHGMPLHFCPLCSFF